MTAEALRILFACGVGYLLGSVLPADLLAQRRGVDIRAVGDGNPGTANAFKGLGWPAGTLTAFYDGSVGIVAILVGRALGVPENAAYLAGLSTLVGHRFPAFRHFRGGGQGMAASAGMILYGMTVALSRDWLSPAEVGALVVIAVITLVTTRSDRAIAIVTLPILVLLLVVGRATWQFAAFMTITCANIWLVQLFYIRHHVESLAVRH